MKKVFVSGLLVCAIVGLSSCGKRPAPEGGSREEARRGPTKDLLAADLSNCNVKPGTWEYKEGVLAWLAAGSDVWTKDQYSDFVLELEYKISPECNSGALIRVGDPADWMYTGLEV